MFLAVEMGRVSEVLLEDTRQYGPLSFIYVHVTRDAIKLIHLLDDDSLFQVEHRDPVSDWTDCGVAIAGEVQVPLTVHCSEQVGELQGGELTTLSAATFNMPQT